jgi:hypothetical protein
VAPDPRLRTTAPLPTVAHEPGLPRRPARSPERADRSPLLTVAHEPGLTRRRTQSPASERRLPVADGCPSARSEVAGETLFPAPAPLRSVDGEDRTRTRGSEHCSHRPGLRALARIGKVYMHDKVELRKLIVLLYVN